MTQPAPAARLRVRLRRADGTPATAATPLPWRPACLVAATVVLLTSTGDAFVAAALIVVALEPWAGAAAGLAAAATVARWGTSDLGLVAGDQAVLGPAIATGPVLAAVGSGLAAVAVFAGAASAPGDRRLRAAVAGSAVAVFACGPAPSSLADAGLRFGGLVAGVAVAWVVTAIPLPRWAGAVAGGAAVVAAVLA